MEQSSNAQGMRFDDPDLHCDFGNKISKVCTNPKCKVALRCSNPLCKQCGLDIHPTCSSLELTTLTQVLNSHLSSHQDIVQAVVEIDNKLIAAIESTKKMLAEQYQVKNLPPGAQALINKIYSTKGSKSMSGREGKALMEQMKIINSSLKEEINSLVGHYRKSIDSIIEEVTYLKWSLFHTHNQFIDSKILTENDPTTESHLQFLREHLRKYKSVELVFRASEHNFRAAAFHQKCGSVDNSLTLVRTEFGKTIAAFTPYKWHSVPNFHFVSNPAGGTFILSLDSREKLVPKDTSMLIHNDSTFGPIFGGGWDLYISDQCNVNSNSYTYVSTYNTVDNKYKDNQTAWKALTGAINGRNFKVVEYEVFRVIR